MPCDFGLDVIKKADKVIKNAEKFLKTNETVCACYLYKFLETGDITYFNNYKSIFEVLDDRQKLEAQRVFMMFVENNCQDLNVKKNKK